jgi:hypothetical protein
MGCCLGDTNFLLLNLNKLTDQASAEQCRLLVTQEYTLKVRG